MKISYKSLHKSTLYIRSYTRSDSQEIDPLLLDVCPFIPKNRWISKVSASYWAQRRESEKQWYT